MRFSPPALAPSRRHGFVVLVVTLANALSLVNGLRYHSVSQTVVCSLILLTCMWMLLRDFGFIKPKPKSRSAGYR